MRYELCSFRDGLHIFQHEDFQQDWNEVITTISTTTDDELIDYYSTHCVNSMSISRTINDLMDFKLKKLGWRDQSPIFQDTNYTQGRWRLDFAKNNISMEVAFNHGEAVAWNLLKPVLASELNHVSKAIQTRAGIIITATEELKRAGAFDSAVGTYEKFIRYLKPLSNILTVPMVIIGLKAPEKFIVVKSKVNGKNVGAIKLL